MAFQDVVIEYGRGANATLAVDGISLDVADGDFVALVGPSGCGKSTLLKVAAGLVPTSSGTVVLGGERVTRPQKNVGMAFQSATMLPWRSTLRNVLLPLQIVRPHRSKFRRDKAANIQKAEALLASVGLRGVGSKYPWQLSGGMQQRASLCRALIHEPEILLLDEPFGALDAFTREELWQVLQELWQEKKPTVLLVTHDLREAIYLANRVVVMSARPGRIVHEERIDFPRPRRLSMMFSAEAGVIMERLRGKIDHVSLFGENAAAGEP
ncbi:MAG: ABC transporter ATP-binding protein [Pseudomonadota bacterium]